MEITYENGTITVDFFPERDEIRIIEGVYFEEVSPTLVKGDYLTPDDYVGGKSVEDQVKHYVDKHIDEFEILEP